MHREEAEVKPDEMEDEVNLAPGFVKHPPGHFGVPVVDSSIDSGDATTKQDVVEVGDDEIGIVNVDIEGHRSQHHATESTDEKQGDKTDGKQHGRIEAYFAPPNRRHPAKDLNSRRNGDRHGGNHKEHPQPAGSPAGEHMVRPDDQSQKRNGQTRIGDRRIAENRLAGVDGQNVGNHAEHRQNHDVHRRVGIEPE